MLTLLPVRYRESLENLPESWADLEENPSIGSAHFTQCCRASFRLCQLLLEAA